MSQTGVALSWQDNSNNEDNFASEQSIGNSNNFIPLITVDDNVTSYSVTGLSANTRYFYRVKATNRGGSSAYAAAVSATTLPNPPNAPTTLTLVNVTQTTADIRWLDNANNETAYRVLRRSTDVTSFDTIAVLDEDVVEFSDTGLNSSSGYVYKVAAQNSGGQSAFSNQLVVNTLQYPPTMDRIDDVVAAPNSANNEVEVTGITAGEGENQQLSVTARTDNTTLIRNLTVDYTSPQAVALITFGTRDQVGEATITVRVEDNGPANGNNINFEERSFKVTVTDLPDLIVLNVSASPRLLNAGEVRTYPARLRMWVTALRPPIRSNTTCPPIKNWSCHLICF